MEKKSNKFYQGAQMTKNSFNTFFNNKIRLLLLECNIDVKTLFSFLENNNTAPLSFLEQTKY